MENQQNTFTCNDMVICAVLAYFGEEMIDVQKDHKDDIQFVFKQSPNLQDIVKGYALDEIEVSPKRFAVALRDVKKIIFSHK